MSVATEPRVLAETPHRVVIDADWGFARLDPVPDEATLDSFYDSHYRDLLGRTGRGPDLARLLSPGAEGQLERQWLTATVHADVIDALDRTLAPDAPRTVLDVGCGTGDLLRSLEMAGWDARGTEPAEAIARAGRAAGLQIATSGARPYLEEWHANRRPGFGAVTLMNVLEHVPDPVGLLRQILAVLAPGGALVVRVPNDFNPLQEAVLRTLGGERWWVVAPDHINYFDHGSLRALLERLGYEVVEQWADYPMELFLLTGDDYRGRPRLGAKVHHRRRAFELSLDAATRRAMGRAWAAAGVGRNAHLVARRPG